MRKCKLRGNLKFVSVTIEIKIFTKIVINSQFFDPSTSLQNLNSSKMSCSHPKQCKSIITHQFCGPDEPYCGPALCTPTQYLYWSCRPIITYTSTDEVKNTWNLKRRTANSQDVYYQEMYDSCKVRYF